MTSLSRLFQRLRYPPCTCNLCTGRLPNSSRSQSVSHGLRMVIRGDELHLWSKSRIVEFP